MILKGYPFPLRSVRIHDSIELAYMDTGIGPETIVFIHGLANYAPVWKYQMQSLSEHYRCIAIDLPGNGQSSRGKYPYTPAFYAECVYRFCNELGIVNPVLAGHSMGGQVALIESIRYPEYFKRLILIAPAGIEYYSPHDKFIMQQLLSLGDFFYADEFHLETAIRESFEQPGEEAETIIDELKQQLRKHSISNWRDMALSSIHGMLNDPVNQFLPQVNASCLLLFGENDRLIPNRLLHPMDSPEKIAIQGAALIPQCEMRLIPKAGHFVQIEQRDLVNQILLHWLTGGR